MPTNVRLTKTAVNKLLVNERKAMRERASTSVFYRRTSSMYRSQLARAAKLGRQSEIDYDLLQLRRELTQEHMMPWWVCGYCGCKLSVSKFVLDHMTPIARGGLFLLANLAASCPSCNWQKGIMTNLEFDEFLYAIKDFPPEVQADIKRRLTIGGKWGVRV